MQDRLKLVLLFAVGVCLISSFQSERISDELTTPRELASNLPRQSSFSHLAPNVKEKWPDSTASLMSIDNNGKDTVVKEPETIKKELETPMNELGIKEDEMGKAENKKSSIVEKAPDHNILSTPKIEAKLTELYETKLSIDSNGNATISKKPKIIKAEAVSHVNASYDKEDATSNAQNRSSSIIGKVLDQHAPSTSAMNEKAPEKYATRLSVGITENVTISKQPSTTKPAPKPPLNISDTNDETEEENKNSSIVEKVPGQGRTTTDIAFEEVIRPYSNATSVAFQGGVFNSGYRNQMMSFIGFVIDVKKRNVSQIILPTLKFKVLSNKHRKIMNFADLFDVRHWNSHYPALPRIVACDPTIHVEMKCDGPPYFPGFEKRENEMTKPYVFGKRSKLMYQYQRFTVGRGPLAGSMVAATVDSIIKKGALRPREQFRKMVDDFIASMGDSSDANYMTLHARVEPDMQVHPVCPDRKERNLTAIFESLEKYFPDPPAKKLFIPINRFTLEQEVNNTLSGARTKWAGANDPQAVRILQENLQALNRATIQGLWGGRVRAFELGATKQLAPENTRLLVGAVLDHHVALQTPSVFIGTEISTFSHDIMSTRFHRGVKAANYKYLPGGVIKPWTTEHMTKPEGFEC